MEAGLNVEADSGLSELLDRNRAWASGKISLDPAFFSRLVDQQRPRHFWIGCSDSRVPATEIVDLDPGEMFVHRNVANLAIADDPSFAAALQFAVEALEVQHIIVVGHYGCGGVQAALENPIDDAIGKWLAPVRALRLNHRCVVDAVPQTADSLCESNVLAQVRSLSRNAIIERAWRKGSKLAVHGWVYSIADGLLHPLCLPVTGLDEQIAKTNRGTVSP